MKAGGLVLIENKFTEHSFYECSAWRRQGSSRRLGNPDPDRCNHSAEVVKDHTNQCHQAAWGRRYWDHLAPIVDESSLAGLPHCPAMRHGYQLFRQHALAEGIAQSGCYDLGSCQQWQLMSAIKLLTPLSRGVELTG